MECGILHQTGRISRCLAAGLAPIALLTSPLAFGSALFDDPSVLEIHLSGPLRAISRDRKANERPEYPFVLTVDGVELPVDIRLRGKSRTVVCPFPPLRLDFAANATAGTVFEGQDKLKLVTHCKSDSRTSENNVLEEYTAYRIFNLVSDVGYRVRLLQVNYVDTDDKLKDLDQVYHAFLIESDKGLAARTGSEVVKRTGVPYSQLNAEQTARLYVFQYLIGNFDWSFVLADGAESCCHNIDLLGKDDELYPVPYDFDFSGLVNASYTNVPASIGIMRPMQRVYRGYCKLPIEDVARALDAIVEQRDEIMATVEISPVAGNEDTDARLRYIGYFFQQALEEREDLLEEFDEDCLGQR